MPQQLFPIRRNLDYSVGQDFVVLASSFEEAAAKVGRFIDSDWSASAGSSLGVVQVSDTMSQIEDTQSIIYGDAVVEPSAAAIDPSMRSMNLNSNAEKMFALLTKIAASPAMFHANVAALGHEAKELVDAIGADELQSKATLDALVKSASPLQAASSSTRRFRR